MLQDTRYLAKPIRGAKLTLLSQRDQMMLTDMLGWMSAVSPGPVLELSSTLQLCALATLAEI